MSFQAQMTIARDLDELGRAGDRLRNWLADVLDDEAAADVELALVEALSNSIRHCQQGHADPIIIVLVVTDADVVLEIADGSPAMPSLFEDAGQDKLDAVLPDLDALAEGGRGLSLIVLSMDEVGFVEREGQTFLQMIRHRRPGVSQPNDRR